jgi:hypothetical protein
MKRRCYAPSVKEFRNYGGNGIRVCDRWRYSFENFLTDMGRRPTPNHSIDRFPDKKGNYEPSNCRWATRAEQNRNLNRNVWIEHDGKKMILEDWARLLKIHGRNISRHLNRGKTLSWVVNYFTTKNNSYA